MSYLGCNIEILKARNNKLATSLVAHTQKCSDYSLEETKDGLYTIKCKYRNGDVESWSYLHSKYAPKREAQRFVSAKFVENDLLVYGFGLGYHVVDLFDRLSAEQKLTVLETNINILKMAFEIFDFTRLLSCDNFSIEYVETHEEFALALSEKLDAKSEFLVFPPALNSIQDHFSDIKLVLNHYLLPGHSDMIKKESAKNREINKNVKAKNARELFGKYHGKTFFLISSGPSLNKYKEQLQDVGSNGVIMASGSAFRVLMDAGVRPDFLCLIDPLYSMNEQIKGYEDSGVPLLFTDDCYSEAVKRIGANIYRFKNDPQDNVPKEEFVETGGSVSTAIFSLAIKFGAKNIVFVGQDLCFSANEHHAKAGMYGERKDVPNLKNYIRVKNVDGNYVSTQMKLLKIRTWLESKIFQNKSILYFNLTEGGLPITGARLVRFEDIPL